MEPEDRLGYGPWEDIECAQWERRLRRMRRFDRVMLVGFSLLGVLAVGLALAGLGAGTGIQERLRTTTDVTAAKVAPAARSVPPAPASAQPSAPPAIGSQPNPAPTVAPAPAK